MKNLLFRLLAPIFFFFKLKIFELLTCSALCTVWSRKQAQSVVRYVNTHQGSCLCKYKPTLSCFHCLRFIWCENCCECRRFYLWVNSRYEDSRYGRKVTCEKADLEMFACRSRPKFNLLIYLWLLLPMYLVLYLECTVLSADPADRGKSQTDKIATFLINFVYFCCCRWRIFRGLFVAPQTIVFLITFWEYWDCWSNGYTSREARIL